MVDIFEIRAFGLLLWHELFAVKLNVFVVLNSFAWRKFAGFTFVYFYFVFRMCYATCMCDAKQGERR